MYTGLPAHISRCARLVLPRMVMQAFSNLRPHDCSWPTRSEASSHLSLTSWVASLTRLKTWRLGPDRLEPRVFARNVSPGKVEGPEHWTFQWATRQWQPDTILCHMGSVHIERSFKKHNRTCSWGWLRTWLPRWQPIRLPTMIWLLLKLMRFKLMMPICHPAPIGWWYLIWFIMIYTQWFYHIPFTQRPSQEPKLEVPTIYKACKAYVRDIPIYPTKYGLIWYSTSILGSWNPHWFTWPAQAQVPHEGEEPFGGVPENRLCFEQHHHPSQAHTPSCFSMASLSFNIYIYIQKHLKHISYT